MSVSSVHRTNINITPLQRQRIANLIEHGWPKMSEMMRRSLDEYLDREEARLNAMEGSRKKET